MLGLDFEMSFGLRTPTARFCLTLTGVAVLSLIYGIAFNASGQSPRSPVMAARASVVDISGIWQRATGNPEQPVQTVLIVEINADIIGINVNRVAYLPAGTEYLKGNASLPDTFNVIVMGAQDTPGITDSKVVQSSVKLRVVDADHFQIAQKVTFVRSSRSIRGDVACDIRNPLQISGDEALARGLFYSYFREDVGAEICWFHIAAEQGNAQAELNYGAVLLNGLGGVTKDPARGFAWIQKSAMQGNDIAAMRLSQVFATGEIVPRSAQRSKYWAARAELTDIRWFHRQVFLPVPSWAADVVTPCDPSNPPQISPGKTVGFNYRADGAARAFKGSAQAFAQGRVAYEARALGHAACWFEVAANSVVTDMLPTVADLSERAKVYLGILYAFGLGVEKNPIRGFEYMKDAAAAGDKFGMMYLANFYRYGIGTRPDVNQASALVGRVLKSSEGLDAYLRVQGLQLSGDQALMSAFTGLSAVAEGTTCNEELVGTTRYLKDCVDHEEDWITGFMGRRPAHHTIENPEEIWPEHFDAVVPPENMIEERSGLPVNRHGLKEP